MNPFGDPFGDFDRWLLGIVRFLETALYTIIVKPQDMFGQGELAQTLLAYVWPLAGLAAVMAVVTILVSMVLMVKSATRNLRHFIVPLLVLNAGLGAFWMLIQSWQIGVTRPLAVGMLTFGTGSADLPAQQTMFPDIGTGGDKIITHLAWILILLIPAILAVCIAVGQILAPVTFSIAAGVYAFGQMARRFFVWSLIFLVVTYTAGSPLLAVAYRLVQYSNTAIPNLFWRTLVQLIVMIIIGYVLYRLFTLVQDKTVEIAKETKAKVRGKVDSLTKRGSKTDVNTARPLKVTQKKASTVKEKVSKTPADTTPGVTKVGTAKTQGQKPGVKGSLKFGALAIGRKLAATPPPAAKVPASASKPAVGTKTASTSKAPTSVSKPTKAPTAPQKSPSGKTLVQRPDPGKRNLQARPTAAAKAVSTSTPRTSKAPTSASKPTKAPTAPQKSPSGKTLVQRPDPGKRNLQARPVQRTVAKPVPTTKAPRSSTRIFRRTK